jgi:uncharacterized protein (TIGR03083 family)
MYRRAMESFVDALAEAEDDSPVPACPEWTVRDLLAHQVHQLAAACDGSFPLEDAMTRLAAPDARHRREAGERQDAWIAAGLDGRKAQTRQQLVDEWTSLVEHAPDIVLEALVPDVVVHLYDLLGAIGRRANRDDEMVAEALRFWAAQANYEPSADDSAFELLRAITGRRSRSQAPALPQSVALYGWRAIPLDE